MHIEKIEFGPEKTGSTAQMAFILIVILTIAAAGLTGMLIMKLINTEPEAASTRPFIEEVGKLLAYLIFDMGAIIYLYVKGLLQDEYVTTLE